MPDLAALTPDERAKRKAARDKAIESADVPESTRILLQIVAQHGDDELEANRAGHERTANAIVAQTDALRSRWHDKAPLYLLVLFAMAGMMIAYKINPQEAADAVTTLPGVAGSATDAVGSEP